MGIKFRVNWKIVDLSPIILAAGLLYIFAV